MHRSRRSIFTICAALSLSLCGCGPISSITVGRQHHPAVHAQKGHRGGPPPHAPAHGHRHKHHDHGRDLDLTFDSNLGVYIVVDVPNRYYWDGLYLRIDHDQWYASSALDGDWSPRSEDSLPPGMRKSKGKRAKHGKGKKSSPAKGHW